MIIYSKAYLFYAIFCMKDDISLYDYNVQERVNDFVAAAVAQVKTKV